MLGEEQNDCRVDRRAEGNMFVVNERRIERKRLKKWRSTIHRLSSHREKESII